MKPNKERVIAVLGGGHWGTVLAQMAAPNCREVRLWLRDEVQARSLSATRENSEAHPTLRLHENIRAVSELEACFGDTVEGSIWALPASSCRSVAIHAAGLVRGHEWILHAIKGVESDSLKRMSQVLREELPLRKIGTLSGPNLAAEIAKGEPAVTVIASAFEEVRAVARELFEPAIQIQESVDLAGVEWCGALKNVYAIGFGAIAQIGLGMNVRAWLFTACLQETIAFCQWMGKKESSSFGWQHPALSPAGIGDLLATASSPLSRNFRVGEALARGQSLEQILSGLGSVAEGVPTAQRIADQLALNSPQDAQFPLLMGIARLLKGEWTVRSWVEKSLGLDR